MTESLAEHTTIPALVLPNWLEYTLTGALVLLMLWMILGMVDAYRRRQATDLGVDKRVLDQLAERDAYVEKIEGRNEQLYSRSIELTNQIITISTSYLEKATDFKDSLKRVYGELEVTRRAVEDCQRQHQECLETANTQAGKIESIERMLAQVAVNAAPARPHEPETRAKEL